MCCLSICNSSAAVVCVFCLLFDLNYTLHLPACLHVHPAYLHACLPTCPSRLPAWLTLYLCTCCVGLCSGTFVGVACLACHLNHTLSSYGYVRQKMIAHFFLPACLTACLSGCRCTSAGFAVPSGAGTFPQPAMAACAAAAQLGLHLARQHHRAAVTSTAGRRVCSSSGSTGGSSSSGSSSSSRGSSGEGVTTGSGGWGGGWCGWGGWWGGTGGRE